MIGQMVGQECDRSNGGPGVYTGQMVGHEYEYDPAVVGP